MLPSGFKKLSELNDGELVRVCRKLGIEPGHTTNPRLLAMKIKDFVKSEKLKVKKFEDEIIIEVSSYARWII